MLFENKLVKLTILKWQSNRNAEIIGAGRRILREKEWEFELSSRNPALCEHNNDFSTSFSEAKIIDLYYGQKLKNILKSDLTDACEKNIIL